jgi:hypothetical protein
VFQTENVAWYADHLEKIILHPCSMEHTALQGRKRKDELDDGAIRGLGACSSATIVAGAWVTPEKKLRSEAAMNIHNQAGGEDWKISADDLARTLKANGLVLIGDGERFKVIDA